MPENYQFNEDKPFVFISYSSEDKKLIEDEVVELNRRGVNAWYDAELTVGVDWFSGDVEDKILRCNGLLFYISINSIQSKPVLREINTAQGLGKKIIPVCMFDESLTIERYLEKYPSSLRTDAKTAFEFRGKLHENTFIPHKKDADYYDSLLKKGIMRQFPEVIKSPPSPKEEIGTKDVPVSLTEPSPRVSSQEASIMPATESPVKATFEGVASHKMNELSVSKKPTVNTQSIPSKTVTQHRKVKGDTSRSDTEYKSFSARGCSYTLFGKSYAVSKLKDFMINSAKTILKQYPGKLSDALSSVANLATEVPPKNKTASFFRSNQVIDVSGKPVYVGTSFDTKSAVKQVESLLKAVGCSKDDLKFGETDNSVERLRPQSKGKTHIPLQDTVTPDDKANSSLSSAESKASAWRAHSCNFTLFGKSYTVPRLKDFMIKSAEIILAQHPDKLVDALKSVANLATEIPPKNKTVSYFNSNQVITVSGKRLYVGTSFGTKEAVRHVKVLLKSVGCDPEDLQFIEDK
jgi:hypothetical protein